MNQPGPIPATPRENLRAIRIFFIATFFGALIFSGLVILLHLFGSVQPANAIELESVLFPVLILAGAACLLAAISGYRKSVKNLKNSDSALNDKLNGYRAALIKYVALCEGPALFGIIIFFLVGKFYLLSVPVAMLLAMLAKAPTKKRVTEELSLDWMQQGELE